MPNKYRGEVILKLGTNNYTMRPTFHSLCEIESELGVGFMEVVEKFSQNKLHLKEITTVIKYGIKGYGNAVPTDAILSEGIMEEGIANVLQSVAKFFEYAIGEGK